MNVRRKVQHHATLNNARKADSKRGRKKGDRSKLKKETAFLYFLAHNPHHSQSKKFLSSLLLPSQYTLLREIAVNELAGNIPPIGKTKKKSRLKQAAKSRLKKLAKGELNRSNLHHLLDLIRILAEHTVTYHDLC